MSLEFDKCLKNGKIKPFSQGKALVPKEVNSAQEDLKAARHSLNRQDFKWATIQAYYSMFHAARALLYSRGYRERSHFCLAEAIRTLFVEEKLFELRLVEDFRMAIVLRENADYQNDFSQAGAQKVLKSAEEFLEKAKELVGE